MSRARSWRHTGLRRWLTHRDHRWISTRCAVEADATDIVSLRVLVLLAHGHSNPRIATQLVVSRKSVGTHVEHI